MATFYNGIPFSFFLQNKKWNSKKKAKFSGIRQKRRDPRVRGAGEIFQILYHISCEGSLSSFQLELYTTPWKIVAQSYTTRISNIVSHQIQSLQSAEQ